MYDITTDTIVFREVCMKWCSYGFSCYNDDGKDDGGGEA